MEGGAAQSRRFICIHGHFYQPPRENPWLETVETEDSAAPYHDWNERVTAECYAPNGAARIVNPENRIIRILNNYGRISFNFGPTLLSWLEGNAGRVYRMILDADANSRKRFGGHGSAIAQIYNHIIMPLASTRDRVTEIRWGIADFERRFERKPEGMWLPETAADTESLELLAAEGIKFVVLAPHQCSRVRPLGESDAPQLTLDRAARTKDEASCEGWPEANPWTEMPNASVDTTCAYLVRLKNGRSIAVFFYDGPRSQAIAFNGLLNDGNALVDRLMSGFAEESNHAQLVHVATDGETYGHHHKLGEMALAWALKRIESEDQAQLTNYGQFLELFPPEYEAQIVENTSWSCMHGVERWRSNCGCNNGHAGWNQQWRAPLRNSFDGLRDGAAPLIRERAAALFKDLDAARDAYIDVILDRERTDDFLAAHAARELSEDERVEALQLMELERNLLLMYTSCGWFFDEISGIEGMQVLSYAGRALHLAEKLLGEAGAALEQQFLTVIGEAHSNLPAQGTGADIYQRRVRTGRVNLEQVAAHYAISSVFTNYGRQTTLYCFGVRRLEQHATTSGRARLVTGRAEIRSNLTGEQADHEFAVLHFGDQNITASVKRCAADLPTDEQAALKAFVGETEKAMAHADLPAVIRSFDHTFPGPVFSIQSLFRDEQRRIVDLILQGTISEVEAALSSIYENQASLLRFLSRAGLPRPDALTMAATFALNAGLRRALESEPIDALHVRTYLELARDDEVSLEAAQLGYLADQKMKHAMIDVQSEVAEGTEQLSTLENALLVALTLNALPFELNLWQAQNIWYDVWKHKPQPSVPDPEVWIRQFHALGQLMRISVDDLVMDE